MNVVNLTRDSDDKLPAYAWPGGYPIVYYTRVGEPMCPECATKELDELSDGDNIARWDHDTLAYYEVNYEDTHYCVECDTVMHGAYVEELTYIDEDLTEWDGIDDDEASIWVGEE